MTNMIMGGINFGGSTLSSYIENGTFTPGLTFATPGNLTWSDTASGIYTRIGNVCNFTITAYTTPTYTTASGGFQINGLPFRVKGYPVASLHLGCSGAWPTNVTCPIFIMLDDSFYGLIYGSGSGAGAPSASNLFGVSSFTSGSILSIYMSGSYLIKS